MEKPNSITLSTPLGSLTICKALAEINNLSELPALVLEVADDNTAMIERYWIYLEPGFDTTNVDLRRAGSVIADMLGSAINDIRDGGMHEFTLTGCIDDWNHVAMVIENIARHHANANSGCARVEFGNDGVIKEGTIELGYGLSFVFLPLNNYTNSAEQNAMQLNCVVERVGDPDSAGHHLRGYFAHTTFSNTGLNKLLTPDGMSSIVEKLMAHRFFTIAYPDKLRNIRVWSDLGSISRTLTSSSDVPELASTDAVAVD